MASILLNFEMDLQSDSRLCWAAVSVAIARYYGQTAVPNQVELAKSVFGVNYNQFYEPDKSLELLGNLQQKLDRALTLEEIHLELMNARPIAACMKHFVGWHLVVIYGIDEASNVCISDSQLGKSQWSLDTFTEEYRQYYAWTHSYKTSRRA